MPAKIKPFFISCRCRKRYTEYRRKTKKEVVIMNERDELAGRLTAEAADKFNNNVPESVICNILQIQKTDLPVAEINCGNKVVITVPAFLKLDDYIARIERYCKNFNIALNSISCTQLTTQSNIEDFDAKPVSMIEAEFASQVSADIARDLCTLYWSSDNDVFAEYLLSSKAVTLDEANLLRAIAEFLHTQFSFIDRSAYSRSDIYRYMTLNADIVKDMLNFFDSKFNPVGKFDAATADKLVEKIRGDISNINSGVYYNDVIAKNILSGALNFLQMVCKTNFYSAGKAALAFRLCPDFMDFFAEVNPVYNAAFPADRPFGVFFFYRGDAVGFQVRFSEIARGGWRTVVPKRNAHKLDEMALFDAANDEIFREGFVLAHTQHLKNKDIYEGGSKMIMLLNMAPGADFKPTLWTAQRAVCEAFVSLINYDEAGQLRDKNIVDYLNMREIIEIGPDENMFDDMIVWMGNYAERVGYTLKSGLISGKPDRGINHKEYGVTSFGVYQYLLRTMRELAIDAESEFSVKIAGGPGGDVAGNMMKLLLAAKADGSPVHPQLKITAITDGPAVIFDPAGIDREELGKLVLKANLDGFDPAKLRGDGAYMLFSKPVNDQYRLVECKQGKISERMVDRNEYMSIFQNNLYNYADIFMPCGGRPSTLNINNYMDYMPNGKLSSRAIVEGGNSFITPEARIKLQDAGIPIVKDASANKCGVITSSYEIMSGLLLDAEEFQQEKDQIVQEVLAKLAKLARGEAEWLFAMHKATGKYLTDLTEELSRTINEKNRAIAEFFAIHPEKLEDKIILAHLPKVLAEKYSNRLTRLPATYRIAIASVELATRIVYGQTGSLQLEVQSAIDEI